MPAFVQSSPGQICDKWLSKKKERRKKNNDSDLQKGKMEMKSNKR